MKDSRLGTQSITPLPYVQRPSERVRDALEEAIANGEFDNLPGAGKPLDFSDDDNPFVPADMRLAYRMLHKHGYALPWIDDRRQIEARRAELERQRERQRLLVIQRIERSNVLSPQLRRYRQEQLRAQHLDFVRRHGEDLDDLNRKIDLYNLAVPNVSLQTLRVNRERAIGDLIVNFEERFA